MEVLRRGTRLAGVLLVVAALGVAVLDRSAWTRAGSSPVSTWVPRSASVPVATTPVTPELVPWAGPVEHLFFHTLVIRPDLAFGPDRLGRGFRDYFVTVEEFSAILEGLHAQGWTLVDIHQAVAGEVRVPPGRRPFVLSVDDVNYYDYSRSRGLGWRLVLDTAGDIRVETRDERGVVVSGDDIVPMVDEFVARHPDFSAEGAKGVLAVTGYQGILGERLGEAAPAEREAAVSRAKALADRLKATGWVFASHSYGHLTSPGPPSPWPGATSIAGRPGPSRSSGRPTCSSTPSAPRLPSPLRSSPCWQTTASPCSATSMWWPVSPELTASP